MRDKAMKKTFFAENEALGSAVIVEVKPAEVIVALTKADEVLQDQVPSGLEQRILHVENLNDLIGRWKLLSVFETGSRI